MTRYPQQLRAGDVALGAFDEFDLYLCKQDPLPATFVARYGMQPHEYTTYNVTLLGLPEPDVAPAWLMHAYLLAQDMNIISERDQ